MSSALISVTLQPFVNEHSSIDDSYGHGTAVAALIAAKFDEKGGRGKL